MNLGNYHHFFKIILLTAKSFLEPTEIQLLPLEELVINASPTRRSSCLAFEGPLSFLIKTENKIGPTRMCPIF